MNYFSLFLPQSQSQQDAPPVTELVTLQGSRDALKLKKTVKLNSYICYTDIAVLVTIRAKNVTVSHFLIVFAAKMYFLNIDQLN